VTAFTHRHQSGLWSASQIGWEALVRATCEGVGFATFTETTVHHPPAPDGFRRVWHKDAPDAALYYDKADWAIDGYEAVEIATTRYILGGKHLKPTLHALVVHLRRRAGSDRLTVVVVHWPSAIEGEVAKGSQKFPRVRALFEGLRGVHRIKRHARKARPHSAFMLPSDFNLDWKKLWVRIFFRVRFPGLALSWKHMPAGGTHGDRVIDATLYSRRHLTTILGSRLGHRMPGFDHTPFTTTYRFKRKARR
jgi:hypothetical protein